MLPNLGATREQGLTAVHLAAQHIEINAMEMDGSRGTHIKTLQCRF